MQPLHFTQLVGIFLSVSVILFHQTKTVQNGYVIVAITNSQITA